MSHAQKPRLVRGFVVPGPRARAARRVIRRAGVAKSKYSGAYLALRRAWAPVVAAGEALCHEPVCLMPSRYIVPGSRWHLSHDATGTRVLGPSHAKCNESEGATRGNRARADRFLRL